MPNILHLSLFGPFAATWSDGQRAQINGAKHRALFAMLATAPNTTHSRSWIQETLWSLSGAEHGRASLRRALADLRKLFGSDFDRLFVVTNIEVGLNPDHFEICGNTSEGTFLQGISIQEPRFNEWLNERRLRYESGKLGQLAKPVGKISPSFAVIPFQPWRATKDEVHLSDMLAQEIARALSRSRLIDVISHLSSRQFNRPSLELAQIGEGLNVDYIVYGSLRFEAKKIECDADFISVADGRIHWTRRFSTPFTEFIAGGDGFVVDIARQVGETVLSASAELAVSKPLPDIPSHALYMSSIALMHQHQLSSFSRSRAQLEELIRRSPQHSILHSWLGKWYILSIAQGWSTNPADDTRNAIDCAARALDIDPSCAFSLAVDGMIQSNNRRDFSIASARFEKALEIDPNNALAWLLNSRLHAFTGQGRTAVDYAERARSLSPVDPNQYFFDSLSATAYLAADEFEQALNLADRSLLANPRHHSSLRVRSIALQLLGREAEAKSSVEKLLRREPGLTVDHYLRNHPAAHHSVGRKWADALGRAGVPAS